jgi:4-hydroxy-3-methylbut-2-enyl diphosphate reductase IspH
MKKNEEEKKQCTFMGHESHPEVSGEYLLSDYDYECVERKMNLYNVLETHTLNEID